jgi:hypothetical protein
MKKVYAFAIPQASLSSKMPKTRSIQNGVVTCQPAKRDGHYPERRA